MGIAASTSAGVIEGAGLYWLFTRVGRNQKEEEFEFIP
jgi:hypothetical protein